jgi:hypothetical protein
MTALDRLAALREEMAAQATAEGRGRRRQDSAGLVRAERDAGHGDDG